jgi:hypothetical protein
MTSGNLGGSEESGFPKRGSAHDLRERFAWLNQFSEDELREISFCAENEPLQEGELYFDISNPERNQIVGKRGDTVPAGSCYVRRSDVGEQTWQKLLSFGKYRQAGF